MIPNGTGGYTFLGQQYKYVCYPGNSNNNEPDDIVIRVRLLSEDTFSATSEHITLPIKDINRDIIRGNKEQFPKDLSSSQEKLTWLAENDYIPSYIPDSNTVFFKKQSFHTPLTNRIVRSVKSLETIDLLILVPLVGEIYLSYKLIDYYIGNRSNNILDSCIFEADDDDLAITIKPSTTLNLPKFPSFNTQNFVKFPLNSLKTIMTFTDQLALNDIIGTVSDNMQSDSQSSFLSDLALKSTGYTKESPEGRLISSNASLGNILYILAQGVPSLKDDLAGVLSSQKTLGKKGGFKNAYDAFKAIKSYIDKFYTTSEPPTLDLNKLAYHLLNDDEFFNFLRSKDTVSHLAKLFKAVGITQLEEKSLNQLMSVLARAQPLFSSYCKNPSNISQDPMTIFREIYNNDIKAFGMLMVQFGNFITEIAPLIEIFTFQNPFAIECLLNSQNKPTKMFMVNSSLGKVLYDCKALFEKYTDDSLGVFTPLLVTTPLQSQIKNRKIENFIFNALSQKVFKNSNRTSKDIFTNINRCAFERFSFNNSQFHNFNFENNVFKLCDFSDVLFFGNVTFKNVYMDDFTASTFIAAIRRSSELSQCELKTFGLEDIQIISKTKLNDKIDTIQDEFPDEESDYQELSSTEEELAPEDPGYQGLPPPPNSNQSTFYSVCSGIANLPGQLLKKGKDYLKTPSETTENIKDETTQEKAKFEQAETVWKNLAADLQKDLDQLKKDLTNTKDTSIKEIEDKIYIQQRKIAALEKGIKAAKDQRLAKEKIISEQNHLLNHHQKQIKLYYQTLLSNLCGFLQMLGLASHPQSILKQKRGKATELSNNVEMIKPLTNEQTDTLNTVWNMLCAAGNHCIEFAHMSKSLIGLLPGAKLIKKTVASDIIGGINSLVDYNDKTKVQRTNILFRGLTSKKIEKIADEIARKLTFSYEEQILRVSEDSAIVLAECACQCIAGALLNGQLKSQDNLVDHAWLAVRRLKTTHNAIFPILNLPIPLTNKSLPGIAKNTYFTARDLYLNSGVAIIDGNQRKLCPLEKHESSNFGYFRVKIEDYPKYSRTQAEPVVSIEPPQPKETSNIDSNSFIQYDRASQIEMALETLCKTQEETNKGIQELRNELFQVKKGLRNEFSVSNSFENVPIVIHSSPNTPTPIRKFTVKSQRINKTQNNTNSPLPTPKSILTPEPQLIPTTSINAPPKLLNLGTSCYINAAMQIVFNIKSVCDSIKDDNLAIIEDNVDILTKKIAFKRLLKTLVQDPSSFKMTDFEALRLEYFESRGISGKDLKKNLHKEQQSPEFLEQVLDIINWKPISIENRRILPDGEIIGSNIVPTGMITLCLPKNYLGSLENALKIQSVEQPNEDTPWIKQAIITNSPEHIIIELKRVDFKINENLISQNARIKLPVDQIVEMPCGNEIKKYEIISYIKHGTSDISKNSGHYTAYVKNEKDGTWYFCNDNKIFTYTQFPSELETNAAILVLKKMPYQDGNYAYVEDAEDDC